MKLGQHATSIALVMLALAGGVWVLMDRGHVSDRERQDRPHDVFPAYRRADVDRLELAQGATRITLVRQADPSDAGESHHWQMTSPVEETADPSAVDRLLGDLEFAGAVRKVDPAASADIARGFEAPRVVGTLSMTPLVYRFALGGPAPIPEGAAYLRIDGEGTFVVSKDLVASLTAGPEAYRERTVIPYLSIDLRRLEVQGPGGGFTIERVDDVSFKLAGSGLRASRETLDRVWGAFAEARAETFLPDAEADRALGPSPLRVVMTPKDAAKRPGEVLVGGACPGRPEGVVLVRRSPTRGSACVPKGVLSGLSLGEDAIVDRRLFAAHPDEVEEVVFETVPPGTIVEIARMGKGWHERKPTDRELAGTEIDTTNELVGKLARAEASAVDPDDPKAPFQPRARMRVRRSRSSAEEVVELGGASDVLRRAFDGARLHVTPVIAKRIWPTEIALRGRQVFPDAMDGAAVRTLHAECGDLRQSLSRDGGQWTLREPRGFGADATVTTDVVSLVRNAQAESWIADRDDGSFGLGQGACRVEIGGEVDGAARTMGIVFGKEAEGGAFFARTTTSDAVFLAPRPLRDAATTWLIDRGAFHVDPAAATRITLSRGAAHVTFKGGGPIDAGAGDTATRVLLALEVLRPDTVVHVGPPRPDEGFGSPTLDVRVKRLTDAGAPSSQDLHFVLGDTALMNRERVVFARVDGVDATFGIARDRLGALLQAL